MLNFLNSAIVISAFNSGALTCLVETGDANELCESDVCGADAPAHLHNIYNVTQHVDPQLL